MFKKEISESMIEKSLRTMKELVLQIPGLLNMEYGPCSSPEGMKDGLTHKGRGRSPSGTCDCF